ncbi:hypothetical protein E1265_23920 [Streptomyces sp. 8K308]|nr:hypothetical protein E1265_23920 [Streptomyces sp. 8K308]
MLGVRSSPVPASRRVDLEIPPAPSATARATEARRRPPSVRRGASAADARRWPASPPSARWLEWDRPGRRWRRVHRGPRPCRCGRERGSGW